MKPKPTRKDFIDLTGHRYGRLTVIEYAGRAKNGKMCLWRCVCDCGKEIVTQGNSLRSGNTKSCGCYCKEVISRHWGIKYEESGKRICSIHGTMMKRCYNKNSISYPNYGGRGITVCEEWSGKGGIRKFYDWAMANGYSDDLTLDRIDNDGNYCPENCKWSTRTEQSRNRRSAVLITYNGETHNIKDWSDITGIKYSTLRQRVVADWDIDKMLTVPVSKHNAGKIYKEGKIHGNRKCKREPVNEVHDSGN